MAEGGKKLAKVRSRLAAAVKEGVSAEDIEELADKLIAESGGKPSFKMVPGYSWATCINVDEGVVHGIPKKEIVFKKGDLVSIDLGLFYKGFHTDTSFTVGVCANDETEQFLEAGRIALAGAIEKARVGNRIYDLSEAIQGTLVKEKLNPIKALVGHGIGKDLHEEPPIPCFVDGKKEATHEIPEGAVLAIEVMYTKGKGDVKLTDDSWTIVTQDGKIAGLFEETVAITRGGPKILTR